MTFEDLSKQLNTSVQSVPNLVQVLSAAFADMEGGGGGSAISYSIEEQDTGIKWIDGNSIYQKTWIFNTAIDLPAQAWATTPIVRDASGINNIINAEAGKNGYYSINVYANSDQTNVQLLQNRNVTVSIDYVTLRYTKA